MYAYHIQERVLKEKKKALYKTQNCLKWDSIELLCRFCGTKVNRQFPAWKLLFESAGLHWQRWNREQKNHWWWCARDHNAYSRLSEDWTHYKMRREGGDNMIIKVHPALYHQNERCYFCHPNSIIETKHVSVSGDISMRECGILTQIPAVVGARITSGSC